MNMYTPPLVHGLLLVGGKSRRMGQDKAEIKLGSGKTLRDRGLDVLSKLEIQSFLSVANDDQRKYEARTIRDRVPDLGPLGALDSAFAVQPDHAWLVIACDMPNLTPKTLRTLLDARDPSKSATCFLNPVDGMAEPLCSIYEPSAASAISEAVQDKRLCARSLLASLSLHGVIAEDPEALANCNRPEHLLELKLQKKSPGKEKKITIEFFASLREKAQEEATEITTTAITAAGLWDELRLKHGFHHDIDTVRLALNDEFSPWSTKLKEGDRAAFLPPFAGG
jgi:molybdopterin-guanine dinucleotide biosynthesis protein A